MICQIYKNNSTISETIDGNIIIAICELMSLQELFDLYHPIHFHMSETGNTRENSFYVEILRTLMKYKILENFNHLIGTTFGIYNNKLSRNIQDMRIIQKLIYKN